MDKGIKQTYRLTTEDGRSIRTTTQHPYLIKSGNKTEWLNVDQLKPGMEIAAYPEASNEISLSFVDETGTNRDASQPYFGVGTLIVTNDSEKVFALNQKLRNIFMNAVSNLKVNEERFEFKFKNVTRSSLPHYLTLLQFVEKNIKSFIFRAIFAKPERKLWEQYLAMIKRIIPSIGTYIVIADYLHKPKGAEITLASLENKKIIKTLQIEAQGSVFLQLADIFLGAMNFQLAKRKDPIKKQLAKKAFAVLQKL